MLRRTPALFALALTLALTALTGVVAKPSARDRRSLYDIRRAAPPNIVYSPKYALGECRGPWCKIGAVASPSPTDPTGFTPYAAPNRTDPNSFAPSGRLQTEYSWNLAQLVFGAHSLTWEDDLRWLQVQVRDVTSPALPPGTPTVLQADVAFIGSQTQRMVHKPTVSAVSSPQPATGPPRFLVNLGTFDFVDTAWTEARGELDGLDYDDMVNYDSLPGCAAAPFGFSQARRDWNELQTSLLTAADTAGRTLSQQLTQLLGCIDTLLARDHADHDNILQVEAYLSTNDAFSEGTFLDGYTNWLDSKGLVASGKLPTFVLMAPTIMLDRAAIVGLRVQVYNGRAGEKVRHFYHPNVFGLPGVYSHAVRTPGGGVWTSQIFGCLPITALPDGSPNPNAPCVPAFDTTVMTIYMNAHGNNDPVMIRRVTEYDQMLKNAQQVIAMAGHGIEDFTFHYNLVAPSGASLTTFFAADWAMTKLYNNTQGPHSPFRVPILDDGQSLNQPFFAGGIAGTPAGLSGTLYSSHFRSRDIKNDEVRSSMSLLPFCDGTTDIRTCPYKDTRELGAQEQPVFAVQSVSF